MDDEEARREQKSEEAPPGNRSDEQERRWVERLRRLARHKVEGDEQPRDPVVRKSRSLP